MLYTREAFFVKSPILLQVTSHDGNDESFCFPIFYICISLFTGNPETLINDLSAVTMEKKLLSTFFTSSFSSRVTPISHKLLLSSRKHQRKLSRNEIITE